MIKITRLNGQEITVNPHLIETIEATPDTVIALTTGKKFVVTDSVAEITEKIIEYRKTIHRFQETDGVL
ncbi:flagellar protein FlbD [Hydrogenispora ethanolica]|uniref:Flagellar protein FlbD n=1 Tax=Hydrogenispora ethanolica TaxID=1082276 RepID=A0A4R1RKK4_HYDET|nr:flagellar FlbD family protein [Hydrogenispora ethanolica]TCL66549.1 flagellar protein FlbD [Hydrogenispora ethanolica]